MSRTKASCGKRFGVQRVCHVWEQSRSSHYAVVGKPCASSSLADLGKRGPKTASSDSVLLAAIKRILRPHRFLAKGIARSGRACGSGTKYESVASGSGAMDHAGKQTAFPFSWPVRKRRSS